MADYPATAEIDIDAPPSTVWKALTDPELIARYFFGSRVDTDWQPGSSITWNGEWKGRPYQDRGTVLDVQPNKRLQVSHFSPLSGVPDTPENYHIVTYDLTERGNGTHVSLTQTNSKDEKEAAQNSENWRSTLKGLKHLVEA